ncbi:MAG TPA: hypothetical protein VK203_31400 [Nostocaceae cyanobacterium]|nr:hypothetical protein [Nostocaceae cyanobacterium]
MSRSLDIFVASEMQIMDFVEQIESLLDIKLQLIRDEYESWYEYHDSNIHLILGGHEFENDRDMNFEDYRYLISIRARNIETEEEREKWRNDFTDKVFSKLKETQKYPLMLVDDVQTKLEEFFPISNSLNVS